MGSETSSSLFIAEVCHALERNNPGQIIKNQTNLAVFKGIHYRLHIPDSGVTASEN